ncbi:histidine phosphatase family protein [Peptoniphilus stercorisuis]|uniref:Phosphoglycerate mutase n=1 Tax=Peptoniphilus stercorisuis TaxID=1436965 RepID=A0ABS4KB13_9FIRM|nr:histidine phosphatase family protein [Peptoniphilus stercorisuis]MBP2024947.1 putative phosphoglycerate mutase [Peptoniphilus stercorisuis]
MNIYFTRHGETQWNKSDKIQGWLDSPLTDKGVEMGKELSEIAKDINFDNIYSSDLNRAYNTAKLIVPEREVIKTELLREIDVGAWSGHPFSEAEKIDKKAYDLYFNNPGEYRRDDGEDFYQLTKRVEDFFEKYVYNSSDENILIVSHGITIIAMFNIMENVPIEKFWTNRVRRNGEFNIAKYENNKFEIIKKAAKNPVSTIG